MQRHLTRAFFGALVVLLFSGCDLIGVGGGYSPSGGGGSNTGEKGWPEPPAFFKLLEGEDAPPNPIIEPTDGSEFLYKADDAFDVLDSRIRTRWQESRSDTTARPETEVVAYQVTRRTTYWNMVQSAGKIDSLAFTEHQLIAFVRQNKDWVRDMDYVTFVLFEIKGETYLAKMAGSGIDLCDLNDQTIWDVTPSEVRGGDDGPGIHIVGRYWRIIVPKQG